MDEVRVIRVVIDLDGSAFEAPSADASEGAVSPDGAALASSGGGSSGGSGGSSGSSRSRANNKMRHFMKMHLISYGKKTLSAAEEMIGSYYDLEEEYKARANIANARSFVNGVASIVQAAHAGYAVAGPVGMAVGAVGATAGQFIGVVRSYASEAERLAELAYNKRYKSEALGLIDGSRGTEN